MSVRWQDKRQIGDCTLYLGDCVEILPSLGVIDAVVSDPPYGAATDTASKRFSGGGVERGTSPAWSEIVGDDRPFDPSPLVHFDEVILFGYQHFAARVSRGQVLVWIKKQPHLYGSFLADAELAWQKHAGHGVYVYYEPWASPRRMKQGGGRSAHPTQKPVGLMEWCVGRTQGRTVCDPFMGSGTTGVACAKLGRRFVGIEVVPEYFEIACKRIEAAYAQGDLFVERTAGEPREARP